jgi:hypothetical protein
MCVGGEQNKANLKVGTARSGKFGDQAITRVANEDANKIPSPTTQVLLSCCAYYCTEKLYYSYDIAAGFLPSERKQLTTDTNDKYSLADQ